MKKIIVIGGLSAGPSAAAKARREDEDAEIILFEKGANISDATCGMPYAFSGVIENRSKLIVLKRDNYIRKQCVFGCLFIRCVMRLSDLRQL